MSERVNSAAETGSCSQPDTQQLRPSQHRATVTICGLGTGVVTKDSDVIAEDLIYIETVQGWGEKMEETMW